MKRRLEIDRRSGFDRREVHDLEYFERGGVERRAMHEKRQMNERRVDWLRISPWSSARNDRMFELKLRKQNLPHRDLNGPRTTPLPLHTPRRISSSS